MAVYYIGAFPPVYGGVTIKNKNLYEALSNQLTIQKVDMNRVKQGSGREILRLFRVMLTGKQFVIGLAGQKNRRVFTNLIYRFRRKAMARSVMLVMGGIVDDIIQAGPEYIKRMNTYRRVYVELPGMAQKLEAAGVTNAAVYPNARPRPGILPELTAGSKPLQCVFFSIIQPEKGVDLILEAANQAQEMKFHFYGEIKDAYQLAFMDSVREKDNVTYHGVFTGDAEAVYRELAQYDVLLLPTRWKAEGLPGILIESKIAGVCAVVSDHNFNREIVKHDLDGIILEHNTAWELVSVLKSLDQDREKLLGFKQAAKASAQRYYIDVCVSEVIEELQRG